MKTILTRLPYLITGYPYKALNTYDDYSQRKITIYALSMMLSTCLWALNGYFLVVRVLGGPTQAGIFTGLTLGLVIFAIERIIIMANGSRTVTVMRVVLAITSASLGSFVIKSVVFSKDIEKELISERADKAESIHKRVSAGMQPEIDDIVKNIAYYQAQYEEYVEDSKKESKGGISGNIGAGRFTRYYDQKAEAFFNLLGREKNKFANIQQVIDQKAAAQVAEEKSNEGIWTKINAFLKLAFSTVPGRIVFSLFFTMLMCIELMTIIVKMGLRKSLYDIDEDMITAAGIARAERTGLYQQKGTKKVPFTIRRDPARTGPNAIYTN